MITAMLRLLAIAFLLAACAPSATQQFDVLILNGSVFVGDGAAPIQADVGIVADRIRFIGDSSAINAAAPRTIDAEGLWVLPGFIDPHSHGVDDLFNGENGAGYNNLAQGVTSVVYGNDGYGSPNIAQQLQNFEDHKVRTNVALMVGHGIVRSMVMGRENRAPSEDELERMRALVASAMQEGALGLSTGLFYVPGTYATTDEVIELAEVAASFGGIYESHIRDESNYNIGVVAAVDEVLEIGRTTGISVHIAHIKALGVDVWGKSDEIIALIEAAQAEGVRVTADQYPWLASGIQLHKAIVPSWALEGSELEIQARLADQALLPQIKAEMAENIRRRGGPESLLLVISPDSDIEGMTLAEVGRAWRMTPVDAAVKVLQLGVISPWTRVASFNMSEPDVEAFMQQPWVMTSSDGTDGHPRKYASYANKYRQYVVDKSLLSAADFVQRSTSLVADTFGIAERGYVREGYFADLAIIDPENYRPGADFANWNVLAQGVEHVLVNGEIAIYRRVDQEAYAGRAIGRAQQP